MPIVEKTPAGCFKRFKDHIGSLVSRVLTERYVVQLEGKGSVRTLFLGDAPRQPIPLVTERFGTLHFYLAQELEAVEQ